MGGNYLAILGVTTVTTVMSCSPAKKEYASFELYPVRTGSLTEMEYTPLATKFYLWSPTAEEVRLMLYDAGEGGHAYETVKMEPTEDGTWTTSVDKNLLGKFYAFNVKINDKWQGDTPGINAHAVGVNGKRAAIIDWKTTNPEGWESDRRPSLKSPADMIIYEMHHRDFSVDSTSGIKNKGKYLALTEHGTMNSDKLLTGIDHLIELGVTHVHLLPSSDYASIDETKLEENHYNWGYDPANYNVPDGSYSTDPYQPATRVKEFKQMVQALHRAGIRVIMDMVYNHTFNTVESNFERTVPGYFYRQKEDGTLANGSGCGNETASERPMMRKFMIESVLYWIKEYHIDGFRFDLTKGFTQNKSNESTASNKDDSRIVILKDYYKTVNTTNPNAVMILEHFCNLDEESELAKAGMKLWHNMNESYCQSGMGESSNSDFSYMRNSGMPAEGWVNFMESHDEERVAYKQTAFGNLQNAGLDIRMKQLGTNAAFFLTVPGPKMIWQFGELGYDYSIMYKYDGTMGTEKNTDAKPVKWDYLTDQYRKGLYDTYSTLLKLRNDNPDLFSDNAFKDWKVSVSDWDKGRYLRLESTTKKLVVVGNFKNEQINTGVYFGNTGDWYELNGETLNVTNSSEQPVVIPANSFKLYTNFPVNN